jgi:hypothetical protein
VPLSAGQAACTVSSLSAGAHAIGAVYSGDASFSLSTSAGLGQLVTLAPTTTSLVSSANPSVLGQPVTFTAMVSPVAPSTGTPSGSVTFKDSATVLCSAVPLSAGQAACTVSSLSAGAHAVSAVYSGDASFAPSTSVGLGQLVNVAKTTSDRTGRGAGRRAHRHHVRDRTEGGDSQVERGPGSQDRHSPDHLWADLTQSFMVVDIWAVLLVLYGR